MWNHYKNQQMETNQKLMPSSLTQVDIGRHKNITVVAMTLRNTSLQSQLTNQKKKTSTRIHRLAAMAMSKNIMTSQHLGPTYPTQSWSRGEVVPSAAPTPRPQCPAPRSPPPARCGWGDPAAAGGCSERPSCTDGHAAMAGTAAAPWVHGRKRRDAERYMAR